MESEEIECPLAEKRTAEKQSLVLLFKFIAVDGVIENIYFVEGEEIVKNKKLVDISTKELSLKLKIALADSKLAESNLNRDEKLAKGEPRVNNG